MYVRPLWNCPEAVGLKNPNYRPTFKTTIFIVRVYGIWGNFVKKDILSITG